ncbi:unnamed protein product, partial [Effrenium voratum]
AGRRRGTLLGGRGGDAGPPPGAADEDGAGSEVQDVQRASANHHGHHERLRGPLLGCGVALRC